MAGVAKKTIIAIVALLGVLLLMACNNQPAYYPEKEEYALTEDIEAGLFEDNVPDSLESNDGNSVPIVDIVIPHVEYDPLEAYELCPYLCPYCGKHYVDSLQRQLAPSVNIHEMFVLWKDADIDFSQEEHDAIVAKLDCGFHCPHTIIYAKLEGVWPITIALWTDRSLRYMPFERLFDEGIYHMDDCCWRRELFNAREVPFTIDELFPNSVAVLYDACSYNFITHGAIIFTDAQGIQRLIFMSESGGGNYWPLYHIWPRDRLFQGIEDVSWISGITEASFQE